MFCDWIGCPIESGCHWLISTLFLGRKVFFFLLHRAAFTMDRWKWVRLVLQKPKKSRWYTGSCAITNSFHSIEAKKLILNVTTPILFESVVNKKLLDKHSFVSCFIHSGKQIYIDLSIGVWSVCVFSCCLHVYFRHRKMNFSKVSQSISILRLFTRR